MTHGTVEEEEEEAGTFERLKRVRNSIESLTHTIFELKKKRNALLEEEKKLCAKKSSEERQEDQRGLIDYFEKEPFPWDSACQAVAQDYFGITEFRLHQRTAINALLSKKDVFLVMATGAGKSLCFHVPSLIRNETNTKWSGCTVVISPLLSLMHDQVSTLRGLGVTAVMLTSETPREVKRDIYNQLMRVPEVPTSEYPEAIPRFIYVTPETMSKSKTFMKILFKLRNASHLTLLVIDEVHCVSTWGRTFRQDYQHLCMLKIQFPQVPLLCLTATATSRVIEDIKELLNITKCIVLQSPVDRANLFYGVVWKPKKSKEVCDLLAHIVGLFPKKASGIIYCLTQKDAETVSRDLMHHGVACSYYHGRLTEMERLHVYNAWIAGDLQIVVATIAFGMGIHKHDVRFVIHHSVSKCMDTYYQETGRAGRDGLPSLCLTLYRPSDVIRQTTMVYGEPFGLTSMYRFVRYLRGIPAEPIGSSHNPACRHWCITEFFSQNNTIIDHCDTMCDICLSLNRDEYTKQENEEEQSDHKSNYASLCVEKVFTVLDRATPSSPMTLFQLASAVRKEMLASPDSYGFLTKNCAFDVERLTDLLLMLIVLEYIREEFVQTPYSTYSYCILTQRAQDVFHHVTPPPCIHPLHPSYYDTSDTVSKCTRFYRQVFAHHLYQHVGDSSSVKLQPNVHHEIVRLLSVCRTSIAKDQGVLDHFIFDDVCLEHLANWMFTQDNVDPLTVLPEQLCNGILTLPGFYKKRVEICKTKLIPAVVEGLVAIRSSR